jgi:polysaccharide biosynthesis/export protein
MKLEQVPFFRRRLAWLVVTALAISVTGLAQTPPQSAKPQQPRSEEAKPDEAKPGPAKLGETKAEPKDISPEAPPIAAAVDPRSYIIGTEDVVAVSVWREPELTRLYVVRPDGKISMPLGGDVEVAGATPEQMRERVTAALSEFMTEPKVTVEIRQVNSKKFFISGEVGRPGPFSLVTPMTVLEALSLAGGLREFANGKKIVIMRNGERLKFNYRDVLKGKNMEQNIPLKPGDHIIVP